MEVIHSSESFKWVDGRLQFHYVQGFFRSQGSLFVAKWPNRQGPPEDMYDQRLVATEDRGPVLQAGWTVADEGRCQSYHVKTPSLLSYANEPDLEALMLREILTCEVLRRHPHPNIVRYLGCLADRGRASALCFEQCTQTLADRVNPGHLNKRMFLESDQILVSEDLRQKLLGLKAGVDHLHSLGLAHNDINPSNVMFDEHGKLVLVDFDSCRQLGEDLHSSPQTKRTHEWHDRTVSIARVENDLDAMAEIETWLFGSSIGDFVFT